MAEASKATPRRRAPVKSHGADVRVECFMVAGSAESRNNSLSILSGGWEGFVVDDFPSSIPALGLGVMLALPREDRQRMLTIKVHGDDPDTDVIEPFELQFNPLQRAHITPGDQTKVAVSPLLMDFPVQSAGHYEFTLYIDGTEVAKTGFWVGTHEDLHGNPGTSQQKAGFVRPE